MTVIMKKTIIAIVLVTIIGLSSGSLAQQPISPADPEYYAMERQQMRFDDYQVMLINYRGFACPRQYSMTSFTSVQFLPISAPAYTFNLNFFDHNTGKTIRDDVPAIWDKLSFLPFSFIQRIKKNLPCIRKILSSV